MSGRPKMTKRDWPFGGRGRRELLGVVLGESVPDEGWTASELARAAGLSVNGSVDMHLAGLCEWGVLEQREGRFVRATPPADLAGPLRDLLAIAEAAPDAPLQPLPRRPYGRGR